MKKILLGTTALVSLVAGSAFAQGPQVTVGGFVDFQAGFADQESVYETGSFSRNNQFQNDTEIHVGVEGRTDSGFTYGAVVELEADVTADADGEGGNADKTFVYLESGIGRVELGNNFGVAKTLKVDASTFARATGGVDGDFYDFINVTGLGSTFIIAPDLPLDAAGTTEDATKISYYSPRYSGVQFGVSFEPDSASSGTAAGFSGDQDGSFENVFGLGLNYAGQYDQIGVNASLTGQFGESELATREDLSAYALGVDVTFANFTVGGSWADSGDSGMASAVAGDKDSNFWTLGAAYVQGPIGASITYIDSEFQGNEFNNVSIGADYQLAPGLVPYAEINFFDLDPAGTAVRENDGTVFLLGTQLNF